MAYRIVGFIGLLLVVCLAGADASAPVATPIPRAKPAVVIDGKLDEPVWQQAPAVRGDYVMGKVGQLSKQPRLVARYAWDEHYLYIGYETFDKNLIAVAKEGDVQGPPKNRRQSCEIYQEDVKVDVVEFFITFGDRNFFWEVHHNALNHFNDVWITVVDPAWKLSKSSMAPYDLVFAHQEFMQDDGPYTLAKAVHLKPKADGKPSTPNDATDEDTGYTAELRLPWLGLGAPAEARTWLERKEGKKTYRDPGPWKLVGKKLQMLAVVQEGDLADRYHHSSPTLPGGWFHKESAHWPGYELAGK